MHYNYKLDENISKTLIQINIIPTDPNKKIKLIIYYFKFKTTNLVIKNNSSPSIGVLQKNNRYINLNVLSMGIFISPEKPGLFLHFVKE